MQALFGRSKKTSSDDLKAYLKTEFGGEVTLFYKARQAIEYALDICNFPKGSKVAVAGFTCAVVPKAVEHAGLTTVFVDVEPNDVNFEITSLEQTYNENSKIRAVIIQNSFGFTQNIQPIEKFCRERNLVLIEDLAHSVGATYPDGRKAGTIGDFVILSFSQDKLLDAVSGGTLIARNPHLTNVPTKKWSKVSFLEQLRDRFYPSLTYKIRFMYGVGFGKPYHWILKNLHALSMPVYNLEKTDFKILPSWEAELALFRLKNLPQELFERRKRAQMYLNDLILHTVVTKESISRSSCLRVPLRIDNRDEFIRFARQNKIHISDIWYDVPVSPKRYWGLFSKGFTLPNAIDLSERIINFPTHMNMSDENVKKVIEVYKKWKFGK